MRSRVTSLAFVGLVLGPLSLRAQTAEPSDSLALARQFTTWLYEGEADSLVAHSTEKAKEGFSTVDQWKQYQSTLLTQAGHEIEVVEETWKLRNGDCQYWRVAAFSEMDGLILLRWVLDEEGRIAGVGLGPEMQAPPVDSEHCG